jgi:Na+-driven multidrug efflux pump
MYANLFWAFFASMLVVIVALYIGHSREKEYGNYIRNGVLGSIWLTLPLYVYLTSYS